MPSLWSYNEWALAPEVVDLVEPFLGPDIILFSTHFNVIPRSHNTGKMGFSDYEDVDATKSVFDTEIIPTQRKDELAVPCKLQPNHCSLHDARTQHGSPPNTSDIRRCGWTLRFIPATSRLNPEYTDRQLMYLARGHNVLDQDLADPSKNYAHVIEERKRQGFKAH
ncbi:MAG: hypothetical protein GVY36_01145 [Verrucomicrobia bacterium]|nr:hypothetical protein [Verrucomicrobiota bacterium]